MKKVLLFLLALCMIVISAAAEESNSYYPFNLQDKTSYDEVVQEMINLFGEGSEETGDSRHGDYAIKPSAKLYGIDIDTIHISKAFVYNDVERYAWKLLFELNINDLENAAEDIGNLYDKLVEIYGEPLAINPATYDYDFDGNKKIYYMIKNKLELQNTIETAKAGKYQRKIADSTFNSFSYTLYWENNSMKLYFSDYSSDVNLEWTKYNNAEGITKEYMMYMSR